MKLLHMHQCDLGECSCLSCGMLCGYEMGCGQLVRIAKACCQALESTYDISEVSVILKFDMLFLVYRFILAILFMLCNQVAVYLSPKLCSSPPLSRT